MVPSKRRKRKRLDSLQGSDRWDLCCALLTVRGGKVGSTCKNKKLGKERMSWNTQGSFPFLSTRDIKIGGYKEERF